MFVRVLQLHKRDSYEYKFIQDKYSINIKQKVVSIADGTTQSYDSGFWANLLCEYFTNKPKFQTATLVKEFKEEANKVKNRDVQFSPNPAKAALERDKLKKGSTSTFLGIQIENENTLKVVSLGDSNLFILNDKRIKKSYPFKNVKELDTNNDFLNTQNLLEDKVDPDLFKVTTAQIQNKDKIILTTDALSRFLFKYPEKINDILEIDRFEKLHAFITEQWEKGVLEEDDITAVVIELNPKNRLDIVSPPHDFSFPKKEEKEFVPTSLLQNQSKKPIFSEMQMSEIRSQFNGVANDFHSLKNKLRIQLLFLILITFLSLANLAFIFIWSDGNPEAEEEGANPNKEIMVENEKINQLQKENSSLRNELKKIRNKDIAEIKPKVDTNKVKK